MQGERSVVFKNGNSMAVRLVGACRLPKGTRVRQYRDGRRIIIEPISEWPQEFIDALGAYPGQIPRPLDELTQRNPFD
jgi:virulence-associated protein VagC